MEDDIKKKRDQVLEFMSYQRADDKILSLPDNDIKKLYSYHVYGTPQNIDNLSDDMIYVYALHPFSSNFRDRLLKILIKRNYAPAYYRLAVIYYAKYDLRKGDKYYITGTFLGDRNCQMEVAYMYEMRGDLELAEKYYEKINANNALIELSHKLFKKDRIKGKQLLLKLMKNDVLEAWKVLLNIYCNEKEDLDNTFFEFLTYKPFQENLPPILGALAKVYGDGLECIDLHFKYSPGEKGAEECKKDFMNRLIKKN